jgi:hypothetical protein
VTTVSVAGSLVKVGDMGSCSRQKSITCLMVTAAPSEELAAETVCKPQTNAEHNSRHKQRPNAVCMRQTHMTAEAICAPRASTKHTANTTTNNPRCECAAHPHDCHAAGGGV